MQNLVELRINQVKTLYDLCVERGITPPYTIAEFEAAVTQVKEAGSDTDLNRLVLFHHKLLHELLYAPPSRG